MALANRASAQRTDARRNWRTTARLRRSAAAALGSSAAAPSTFPSEGMSCSSIHSKQRPRQLSTSRGAMDKPLQPRMPMRARQQEQPPPAHTSPWRTVSRLLVGIAACRQAASAPERTIRAIRVDSVAWAVHRLVHNKISEMREERGGCACVVFLERDAEVDERWLEAARRGRTRGRWARGGENGGVLYLFT